VERYQKSETARISVVVADAAGAGLSGMTLVISARRHDGKWWNPAGFFQVVLVEMPMTEVDAINRPGQYEYVFNPHSLTDFYVSFRARVTGGAGTPANGPWFGDALWGYWVDDVVDIPTISENSQEILKRIGGDILEVRLRQIIALLDYLRQKIGR
jgi:hypothetical protein